MEERERYMSGSQIKPDRYSRLAGLPQMGPEGVERLRKGSALIIGCGALGSMCAMQLAASGVGKIAICDFDTIDISNLQRQLFFDEQSLGKHKVQILAERMRNLNSEVNVVEIPHLIRTDEASRLISEYDVIIDGSDNAETKYMMALQCELEEKPCVIAGISGFKGQVMTQLPGRITYSEIYGPVPKSENSSFMQCTCAAVLGATAAVAASVQAAEAVKILAGINTPLADCILSFDLAKPDFKIIHV